jgi:carbon-monoxide dehydrogenase medium subunit
MNKWKRYIVAKSVDEALQALFTAQGEAQLIGGGTDLILEIQQGHHPPVDTLVDISQIAQIKNIEIVGDALMIGAATTVREIAESEIVKKYASALADACALIGGPQVRNSATIGGNVAHALPAADGMIALVAMGAEVEIVHVDGHIKRMPILQLFLGPGKSTLSAREELIQRFLLPVNNIGSNGSAFMRVMRPQGVALPVLNMAVWLIRDGERISDIRVAAGPAGPTPQRAKAVENILQGVEYAQVNFEAIEEVWRNSMRYRSSAMRASAEYRYYLSGVLLEGVLAKAWERANLLEVA